MLSTDGHEGHTDELGQGCPIRPDASIDRQQLWQTEWCGRHPRPVRIVALVGPTLRGTPTLRLGLHVPPDLGQTSGGLIEIPLLVSCVDAFISVLFIFKTLNLHS